MVSGVESNRRSQWRRLSGVCLAAAAVFLVTAFIMNINAGVNLEQKVPAEGGLVGPIRIGEPFTVLEVDVQHFTPNNKWSFVTGELLDADKNYLTGFGDEMYHETGYDSEGRWVATDYKFSSKLTVRQPGDYFLKFNVESNAPVGNLRPVNVTVEEKLASALPHLVGGVLLIIIGFIMNIKSGGLLSRLFQEN
jgi:hypothetical protein